MTKETYICHTKDLYVWMNGCRASNVWKETYVYDKRNLHVSKKRPIYVAKETCMCEWMVANYKHIHTQTHTHTHTHTHTYKNTLIHTRTHTHTSRMRGKLMKWSPAERESLFKETYIYHKRDPHKWQKRPTNVTQKTYMYEWMVHFVTCEVLQESSVKRDLHIWQKRPTNMTKKTYTYYERDPHTRRWHRH